MTLHTDTPERFERALEALDGAAEVGSGPFVPRDVVLGRVE